MSSAIPPLCYQALRYNPQEDLAYHTLGVYCREVASVGPVARMFAKLAFQADLEAGTYEKALAHFQKVKLGE